MIRPITAVFATLLICSCTAEQAGDPQPDTSAEGVSETDPAAGIAWFPGTVDAAFAAAAESGKPIYLYWGAEWCPPCHAIAATVFRSPEFIDRSKLFVPVYLDGDKPDAQAAGERFGVMGYPTMIVFDSSGTELTRIPNGIDLQAYANILDLTLSNAQSSADLTAAIMAGDVELAPGDCTLLAYYSWDQDASILVEQDAAEVFRRMHAACPDGMEKERSILYLAWLRSVISADEDTGTPPLSDAERAEALPIVRTVLDDPDLVKANIFTVLFDGASIAAALTESGSEVRATLTKEFYLAYSALRADESVYKRERIYSLAGKIQFERIDDEEAELSDDLREEIRETTVWADESTQSVYERQPIINALGGVLTEAGMDAEAKSLLLAELERSKQAYYFMPDIADIEQRAGNYEQALAWLKKAYVTARGPATRFQWGYYYLSGLMEMAPDGVGLIRDTTVGMIRELQESGGFYLRPKSQLNRMQDELLAWAEANGTGSVLDDIREAVLGICAEAAAPDESCTTFLEPA